jgi:lipoate-protein ligase B
MRSQIERLNWGLLDYQDSLEKMRQRHADRVAGTVGDAIICVEHPRVFTLGKRGGRENIRLTDQELADKGFMVYSVERGGNVTYHGPGQAVLYLVVDLKANRMGVRALVEAVANSIVQVASDYGLDAAYDPDRPGVWVDGAKLAAVGMAVPQRVSMHGLAFNVNTRLEDFDHIKACGMDAHATSLQAQLGREVPMKEVFDSLYAALVTNLLLAHGSLKEDKASLSA